MDILQVVRKYTKPYTTYILCAVGLQLIWTICINLETRAVKTLINLFVNANKQTFMTVIVPVMGGLLFNIIISRFTRVSMDNIFFMYLPSKLRKSIRLDVVQTLMKHSYRFYADQFCGSLVSKINDTAECLVNVLPMIFERFFGFFIVLGVSLFTISSAGMKYVYLLIVWSVVFFVFSYKTAYKMGFLSSLASQKRSHMTGILTDIFSNMQIVRLFSSQALEYENIKLSIESMTSAEMTRDLFVNTIYKTKIFLFTVLIFVSCVFLLIDYQYSIVTPGDLSLVLSINFFISDYLFSLSKNFYKFSENIANIMQAIETFCVDPEVVDRENAQPIFISRGSISCKNICFSYGSSSRVINNLNITIAGREKIGLVGYSGAGKSTFINLLERFFDVEYGEITIDGQDIRDITQKSLHDAIGVIPQNVSLFHRSILENIRYGRPEATYEEIVEVAKKAHIHDFIITLKNGYHTLVGESGIKLSGGQKQRIAIARCFLKNPPILILDEATSHLDSVSEKLIQNSLKTLMSDKTTIIIAHRISTIMHLDRILVLDQGHIVEEGPHDVLLQKEGIYATLWSNQINGFLGDADEKVNLT